MMNTLLKNLLICAGLLLTLAAQGQDLKNNPRLQERLLQVKLREIQKTLMLSDDKMKALTPIYKRYDNEITTIHKNRQVKGQGTNINNLTSEEADKLVVQQLDNAVKMSTVRKNYYSEFKTVLTPQQVMAMFRAEAQIRRRVMMEMRRRLENRTK
ncbi:hypothetical protein TH61_17205 [Rufibacter sp. DG15C]|uniref:hypothetical protein n=1 Tax=Rufibacter sp. DG15C TaxID=1379909 RepID=UPI00078C375D|nr:hypothetical protein [Rufibacter sp. DG15C]AMM52569.1 hypothetical protein TH61_17205 [Rufibacter sp. DG15C]